MKINFERVGTSAFCRDVVRIKYDLDIRQTYLSGLNLVVHTANWFYVPDCRIKIWSLREVLGNLSKETENEIDYIREHPDLNFSVPDDDFDKNDEFFMFWFAH